MNMTRDALSGAAGWKADTLTYKVERSGRAGPWARDG